MPRRVSKLKATHRRSGHKGRGKKSSKRRTYKGRGKVLNWLRKAGAKIGSFLKKQLPHAIKYLKDNKTISKALAQTGNPYGMAGSKIASVFGFGMPSKKRMYRKRLKHGGSLRIAGQGFRI